MSNFFEQELRRLFGDGEVIEAPRFVGRACLGILDGDLRVRAEFVNMGIADQYEALRLTVLKRTDGEVDRLILRFKDVFGKKPVSNPNFPTGVIPHFCEYGRELDWYVYHPTVADYMTLRRAVADYLDMFRERVPERVPEVQPRKAPRRSSPKKARDER